MYNCQICGRVMSRKEKKDMLGLKNEKIYS